MGKVFRRIRAIDDRTLFQTLGGQHNALLGVSFMVRKLLRERVLWLVWAGVVTLVGMWVSFTLAAAGAYPWVVWKAVVR